MEIPGYEQIAGGINKALQTLGMKPERKWPGAVIYLLIVIFAFIAALSFAINQVGGVFSSGEETSITNSSLPATDNSIHQTATGNSAPVSQIVNKNEYPKPRLEYSVISQPQKQSDGFFHTTYELTVWHVPGTWTDKKFQTSASFSSCHPPVSSGFRLQPMYADVANIECLSKEHPPMEETLFSL